MTATVAMVRWTGDIPDHTLAAPDPEDRLGDENETLTYEMAWPIAALIRDGLRAAEYDCGGPWASSLSWVIYARRESLNSQLWIAPTLIGYPSIDWVSIQLHFSRSWREWFLRRSVQAAVVARLSTDVERCIRSSQHAAELTWITARELELYHRKG